MKFTVTMKDPDTLYDAINDAIEESLSDVEDEDEREAIEEVRKEKLKNLCAQWFDYGEYLTVEIDTEANTCTVVKPK